MNFKKALLILSAAALSLLIAAPAAARQPLTHPDRAPGELIIRLKPRTDRVALTQTLSDSGSRVLRASSRLKTLVIKTSSNSTDLQAKLSKLKAVASVEPNFFAKSTDDNDNYFLYQWGLNNTAQRIGYRTGYADADIDAPEAWGTSTGSGVKVAVLDSGVDQSHPDLSAKLADQANFSDSSTYDDEFGHGTHVAGIIAAITNNGQGVAGVCPDCQIMNGKVLSDDGYGEYSWIADGIVWAADHGAKVINLSLAGRYPSDTLEQAVNYAWGKGVVVVAAAGNTPGHRQNFPAAYANAVAVAATDNRDRKAYFTTYDYRWVDMAAPGVDILSTLPTHPTYLSSRGYAEDYDFLSGTSMASPMVAGVAGLIWSTAYGTSAATVRSRLESTADHISGTGRYWSAGRVNASSAVAP